VAVEVAKRERDREIELLKDEADIELFRDGGLVPLAVTEAGAETAQLALDRWAQMRQRGVQANWHQC
jgi:hypothetical protein